MTKNKYSDDDAVYFEYIRQVDELYDDAKDIIYNFPAYIGAVNLARYLSLYEIYRRVIDRSGHVADVGTYKGASLLFFAKLIKLFEPYNSTEAHGFDWFKGQNPGDGDDRGQAGKYQADRTRLEKLISLQGLDSVAKLNDLDLTSDLGAFFAERPWLRYKLVFVDCGIRAVMEAVLEHFWPRLIGGGIVVLDHFNDPSSPSESGVIEKFAARAEILQVHYTRSPTAFLIKK
jgi:Methyltransferase domain